MSDLKRKVPFNSADKVTKETNGYAGLNGAAFNGSQKDGAVNRGRSRNMGQESQTTLYNNDPIKEVYSPAKREDKDGEKKV